MQGRVQRGVANPCIKNKERSDWFNFVSLIIHLPHFRKTTALRHAAAGAGTARSGSALRSVPITKGRIIARPDCPSGFSHLLYTGVGERRSRASEGSAGSGFAEPEPADRSGGKERIPLRVVHRSSAIATESGANGAGGGCLEQPPRPYTGVAFDALGFIA